MDRVGARSLVGECAAVAAGAVAGASLRWGAGEAIGARPGEFPLATLAVNVAGCLLAGIAAARLPRRSAAWLVAVTGFLGGLTTYSAFAAETRALLADGHVPTAAVYVVASVGGGLAAALLGRRIRGGAP